MISYLVSIVCTFLLLVSHSSSRYLKGKDVSSNPEIENLIHLYQNGLAETEMLFDSVSAMIHSAIGSGYNNITQSKLESAQLIANSTTLPSDCAYSHSIALTKVDSESVFDCEQWHGLNAALKKWEPIRNDIFLCAQSVNSGCVEIIENEISKTIADNRRDLPDLARSSYICVRSKSDIAINAIIEANQEFFKCLGA